MRLKGTNMPSKLYAIGDQVFDDLTTNFTAKYLARVYAKEHKMKSSEIVELDNDTELVYYKQLREKQSLQEIRDLEVNMPYILDGAYTNAVGEEMPQLEVNIPFSYRDKENFPHFEVVVANLQQLSTSLVQTKILFDKCVLPLKAYLKLLYIDTDGTFKEWHLKEIVELRVRFVKAEHRKMLAEQRKVRQRQQYDRLLRLRAEGKITDTQTKELYKLDEIYNKEKQS